MVPAYILTGGGSSRFGSDKARHPMPNSPQLLVLADQLRAVGHPVHFVADRADRYSDLLITCLVDVQPDSGPLAGLATALEHHRESLSANADWLQGWLMLVSCDQRQWQASWCDDLAARFQREALAIVYFDTQWQPLPGLYHVDLLPCVRQRLTLKQLSLHGLLESIDARCLKVSTEQPPSRWSFNSPADL